MHNFRYSDPADWGTDVINIRNRFNRTPRPSRWVTPLWWQKTFRIYQHSTGHDTSSERSFVCQVGRLAGACDGVVGKRVACGPVDACWGKASRLPVGRWMHAEARQAGCLRAGGCVLRQADCLRAGGCVLGQAAAGGWMHAGASGMPAGGWMHAGASGLPAGRWMRAGASDG